MEGKKKSMQESKFRHFQCQPERRRTTSFTTNGLVKWAKITRLVINPSPNHRQNSCKFRFYKDRQKSLHSVLSGAICKSPMFFLSAENSMKSPNKKKEHNFFFSILFDVRNNCCLFNNFSFG